MSTYATNIPGAPGYEQSNLLARRAYENAMSRYAQRRSQSLLHYGYTRDASGKLGVDPNNEYGAYQQMLRGEDQQSHSLDRAQRASGWGGGGYLGAQQDELQHAQGAEQANLGTSLTNELADIGQGEQDAAYNRDQSLYGNELDAARQALEQGNFNPADYSGLDIPYGDAGPDAPAPPRERQGHGHLKDVRGGGVHQRGKQQIIRRTLVQRARARGRRR